MKAVGSYKALAVNEAEAFLDVEIDKPVASGRNLLVEVRAVSVNPVDTKVRKRPHPDETWRVLGWDASGVVTAIGDDVSGFAVGDEVYYAGCITKPGSNSEYQLVDERIAAKKPASLGFADAAALPLTTITAWEALFERLGVSKTGADAGKSILMIGGAGGVGSIAIQLASKLAGLNIIATASREESANWCMARGADFVINHYEDIPEALVEIGHAQVDYVLCLTNIAGYWKTITDVIKPQGKICTIVDFFEDSNLDLLKLKSASFAFEFMFTRSMHQTDDMDEINKLLSETAALIDSGDLVTTAGDAISPINADNMRKVHATIEEGRAIGKYVLEGWA
ncbi:MAG: zinc-binding alcohol dehydrogenase family protein [Kordiimonadaceae bacterium]|nr:zinc-binding alcohol dehydrogenase family protein [Kordiimonadaceae bacterium]MBT6034884.1 zinc-binding alcohol dehydrogenase family protein [Kordiimonadaceae bacterium]MBT7582286.1 zinc-binding alcohol dehydrogenase family protein [Kordiimonadaceae bacterium]